MSLLQEAKKADKGGHKLECTDEQLDLLLAYLRGEVKAKQMCAALKLKSGKYSSWATSVNSWLVPRLKRCMKEGRVDVDKVFGGKRKAAGLSEMQ